jgi:hypothetical protein
MTGVRTEVDREGDARAAPRRDRALRWTFAIVLVVGTLLGVVVTTALALVLAAPRIMSSGLQPMPEHAALRWLVSPEVSGILTQLLLVLLAVATAALATLVVVGTRWDRVWRAYVAWALAGGALTAYALLANWSLAREAGLLAFVVGALWSVAVGLAMRWIGRRRAGLAGE